MPPKKRVGSERGILRCRLGKNATIYQFGKGAAKAAA
jgi:hypothetical protein